MIYIYVIDICNQPDIIIINLNVIKACIDGVQDLLKIQLLDNFKTPI